METTRETFFNRPVRKGEFDGVNSSLDMARQLIEMERQTSGYCDRNQREFVGQMFGYLTSEEREDATRLGFEAC